MVWPPNVWGVLPWACGCNFAWCYSLCQAMNGGPGFVDSWLGIKLLHLETPMKSVCCSVCLAFLSPDFFTLMQGVTLSGLCCLSLRYLHSEGGSDINLQFLWKAEQCAVCAVTKKLKKHFHEHVQKRFDRRFPNKKTFPSELQAWESQIVSKGRSQSPQRGRSISCETDLPKRPWLFAYGNDWQSVWVTQCQVTARRLNPDSHPPLTQWLKGLRAKMNQKHLFMCCSVSPLPVEDQTSGMKLKTKRPKWTSFFSGMVLGLQRNDTVWWGTCWATMTMCSTMFRLRWQASVGIGTWFRLMIWPWSTWVSLGQFIVLNM